MFVGATNRLFRLSGDLRVEQVVETGPRLDNPMCPPPTSECQCFGANCAESQKTPTDAVNKALVIDGRRRRLLACSSLFQGHCDWHRLTDISRTEPPVWRMVVPNDRRSSVVMFVAPGPPNPASTEALYVAATRSTVGLPAYRDIVPSVCVRNLHDLGLCLRRHSDAVAARRRGPAARRVPDRVRFRFRVARLQLLPGSAARLGRGGRRPLRDARRPRLSERSLDDVVRRNPAALSGAVRRQTLRRSDGRLPDPPRRAPGPNSGSVRREAGHRSGTHPGGSVRRPARRPPRIVEQSAGRCARAARCRPLRLSDVRDSTRIHQHDPELLSRQRNYRTGPLRAAENLLQNGLWI